MEIEPGQSFQQMQSTLHLSTLLGAVHLNNSNRGMYKVLRCSWAVFLDILLCVTNFIALRKTQSQGGEDQSKHLRRQHFTLYVSIFSRERKVKMFEISNIYYKMKTFFFSRHLCNFPCYSVIEQFVENFLQTSKNKNLWATFLDRCCPALCALITISYSRPW